MTKVFIILPGEIWKPVIGFIGYEISSAGRFRCLSRLDKRGMLKKEAVSFGSGKKGQYKRCPMVGPDGKKHYKRVHQLVGIHFIENPDNKPMVNHIDGDKHNNNILNLEWATAKENIHHARKMGLINGYQKYPQKTVDEIRSSKKSNKELAVLYGMDYRYVWMIRKNKCRVKNK